MVERVLSAIAPVDQFELSPDVLRVAARALPPVILPVKTQFPLDLPLDLSVTVHTLIGQRRGSPAVAVEATGRPLELGVRTGQRPRRDLCHCSERRDQAQSYADTPSAEAHRASPSDVASALPGQERLPLRVREGTTP